MLRHAKFSSSGGKVRRAYTSCRAGHGITAVELIVAVGLLAIVVTLGYPSVQAMLELNRQRAVATALSVHIALARSKAIASGRKVAVAPAGARWNDGWRVYFDTNGNGTWDSGEEIIAVYDGMPGVSITANGPLQRYLLFDGAGRAIQTNGAFLAGAMHVCTPILTDASTLVVNAAGRVRSERRRSACNSVNAR